MQVSQEEYRHMIGEFIRGALMIMLPSDAQAYPLDAQRAAMQHVESMSEMLGTDGQYGVQFQRIDGQTIDVIWSWH